MWFDELTGFGEGSPEQVRSQLVVQGNKMTSLANGRTFQWGSLEVNTLEGFKAQAPDIGSYHGQLQVSEIVDNVQLLHLDPANENALFQAASQFNLLEMVGYHVTPEEGIDRYAFDNTQGPACAIACGAGTIYRNYFVPLGDRLGQTATRQIDCLDLLGKKLNNQELLLWQMRNGYALLNEHGLLHINSVLAKMDEAEREAFKGLLKIGLQWDTEVTLSPNAHLVSQAYCSALPVAYLSIESFYWQRFASLILEATYEATLYAALINLEKTGCNKVFLTLVGGGAFGNELYWILDALKSTLKKFRKTPLDVQVVSYGRSNYQLNQMLQSLT